LITLTCNQTVLPPILVPFVSPNTVNVVPFATCPTNEAPVLAFDRMFTALVLVVAVAAKAEDATRIINVATKST